MKIGDKVKVNKDIPSIDGMLREGTVVKIDQIYDLHITDVEKIHYPESAISNNNLRVTDDLGKIWFLSEEDIKG